MLSGVGVGVDQLQGLRDDLLSCLLAGADLGDTGSHCVLQRLSRDARGAANGSTDVILSGAFVVVVFAVATVSPLGSHHGPAAAPDEATERVSPAPTLASIAPVLRRLV